MSTESFFDIRVTRRFSVNPGVVFDAWLDPENVGKWLFATPSGKIVRVEIDARVGGTYDIVDRRDGEDVAHTGEYIEIDRPRRLVFTFSVKKYSNDAARVTIDIVPLETGCELTLTQTMRTEMAEYADRTKKGWADILEGLARTVE